MLKKKSPNSSSWYMDWLCKLQGSTQNENERFLAKTNLSKWQDSNSRAFTKQEDFLRERNCTDCLPRRPWIAQLHGHQHLAFFSCTTHVLPSSKPGVPSCPVFAHASSCWLSDHPELSTICPSIFVTDPISFLSHSIYVPNVGSHSFNASTTVEASEFHCNSSFYILTKIPWVFW